MVISCVAYGCHNEQDGRKPISFHSFPFKRPEILILWVKAVNREDWFPAKTSRLCGEHFLPSDYQVWPGCTTKILKPRLKVNAVPSIFCFCKQIKVKPRGKLIRQDMVEDKVKRECIDIDCSTATSELLNLPSTSAIESKIFIGRETPTATSTTTDDKHKIFQLRRQVKALKQRIRRRNVKISKMIDIIKEISESDHSNEDLNTVLKMI